MNNKLDPIPGYHVTDDKGHAVEFDGLEVRNPAEKPSHEIYVEQTERGKWRHGRIEIPEWLFLILLFLLGGLLAAGLHLYLQ